MIKVEGKRTVTNISDFFSWMSIFDSHGLRLTDFLAQNGSSSISISGGGVDQVDHYLATNRVLDRPINGLFIVTGGNDISRGIPPAYLEYRLRMIVRKIALSRPECIVVTMTIIPRADKADRGANFVTACEDVDAQIGKGSKNHHHVVTDCYVREPTTRGGAAGIREELYGHDLVHLNFEGLSVLKTIMSFVFASVNRDYYDGRIELKGKDAQSFRSAFFKF